MENVMRIMTAFILFLALMYINVSLTGCGKPGPQGSTGETGAVGPSGLQGTPGADATPSYMVKLCPGASSYPTVFIEYAICVQGELYGVYSSNGGFLALLPPGNYSSNAIGSACNLTVGPNCAVSH